MVIRREMEKYTRRTTAYRKEEVMKRLGMLLLVLMVVGYALPYNVDPVDPEGQGNPPDP